MRSGKWPEILGIMRGVEDCSKTTNRNTQGIWIIRKNLKMTRGPRHCEGESEDCQVAEQLQSPPGLCSDYEDVHSRWRLSSLWCCIVLLSQGSLRFSITWSLFRLWRCSYTDGDDYWLSSWCYNGLGSQGSLSSLMNANLLRYIEYKTCHVRQRCFGPITTHNSTLRLLIRSKAWHSHIARKSCSFQNNFGMCWQYFHEAPALYGMGITPKSCV